MNLKVGKKFELRSVGVTTSSKLKARTPDFIPFTGIPGERRNV